MIFARSLAKFLQAEYDRGFTDGGYNVPPDPGRLATESPGWWYENVRGLIYRKGWDDGKTRRGQSWARPMSVRK